MFVLININLLYNLVQGGKCRMKVVSGDFYNNILTYRVGNILNTAKNDEATNNFWLGNNQKPSTAVLDLGCEKAVNLVQIVNTHNNNYKDRSTKKLKVSVATKKDGPWEEVLDVDLKDSSKIDPVPLELFKFKEKKAKFVKVQIAAWYGNGGGLSYFNILDEKTN